MALKGETGPGTPPEACASSQAPPGTPCAAHAARHVQERSVVRGRTDSRRGVCDDAGLGSRPNRGQSPTVGSGVWYYRGWGKFWEGNAPRALLLTRGACISGQSRARVASAGRKPSKKIMGANEVCILAERRREDSGVRAGWRSAALEVFVRGVVVVVGLCVAGELV